MRTYSLSARGVFVGSLGLADLLSFVLLKETLIDAICLEHVVHVVFQVYVALHEEDIFRNLEPRLNVVVEGSVLLIEDGLALIGQNVWIRFDHYKVKTHLD